MSKHQNDKYANYLSDLGILIKQRALEAKAIAEKEERDTDGYYFETGRLLGFNEVITMMQQQALVFQIPLGDLRLEDIDPDRDLA